MHRPSNAKLPAVRLAGAIISIVRAAGDAANDAIRQAPNVVDGLPI